MSKTTDRASKIAASWANRKVRAARLRRQGVIVGRYEYRSVAAAFEDLGLPMGQMIRFRMALKAAGTAKFDRHTFRIVND